MYMYVRVRVFSTLCTNVQVSWSIRVHVYTARTYVHHSVLSVYVCTYLYICKCVCTYVHIFLSIKSYFVIFFRHTSKMRLLCTKNSNKGKQLMYVCVYYVCMCTCTYISVLWPLQLISGQLPLQLLGYFKNRIPLPLQSLLHVRNQFPLQLL